MARRRRRPTSKANRSDDDLRPAGLGSHWRRDGRPKSPYPTRGDALAAAEHQRSEGGADLTVYRCDICASWHMGNPRAD